MRGVATAGVILLAPRSAAPELAAGWTAPAMGTRGSRAPRGELRGPTPPGPVGEGRGGTRPRGSEDPAAIFVPLYVTFPHWRLARRHDATRRLSRRPCQLWKKSA